jgi:hypothetical protein
MVVASLLTACALVRPASNGSRASTPSVDASSSVASAPVASASPAVLPAELRSKAWVVPFGQGFVAGRVGVGVTATLPEGELPLAVHGDLVLTVDAATASVIRIRAVDGAALLVERATDLTIDAADIGGQEAFFAARSKDGSADMGIWRLGVDGAGWTNVLPGTREASPVPGMGSRSVVASGTGMTFGSTWCGPTNGCITDIVSGQPGSRAVLDVGYLRWISDEFALVSNASALSAYAVAGGGAIWKRMGAVYPFGSFQEDGRTAILSAENEVEGGSYSILRVDVATGHVAEVLMVSGNHQYSYLPSLSTDRFAALVSDPTLAGAPTGGITFQILDLSTGSLLAGIHTFVVTSR